jgi:hypothetical protein
MKVSSTDFLNSLIMKPEQEALEGINLWVRSDSVHRSTHG